MKFKVTYQVKKEIRNKVIISSWETLEEDANKVSKKWLDAILIDKTKGVVMEGQL